MIKKSQILVVFTIISGCTVLQPNYDDYGHNHYAILDTEISKDWFQGEEMTLKQVDAYVYKEGAVKYGETHFAKNWEYIKSQMEPGDIIRFYSTPCEWWENWPNGKAGIAIVRKGQPVMGLKVMVQ